MSDTRIVSDTLTDTEIRVLDAIDEHALVEHLVEMIRIPSITGSDAESELQHAYAARLALLGFDIDTWKLDLDDLAEHPDHPGTEAPASRDTAPWASWDPQEFPPWSFKATWTWSPPATSTVGTTGTRGAVRSGTAPFTAAARAT